MPDAYAEIAGSSQRIIGGGYTVGWGTPPGVCGLAVGYSFAAPGRVVNLKLFYRGGSITLRNARVTDPRLSGGARTLPIINFSVEDRRWRWRTAGRIYGSYNVEQRDGTLLREQSPQQLAERLFLQLGEPSGTFFVDALPADPRPKIAWEAADAREELERLCGDYGCAPTFDPVDDVFRIVKIGAGAGPPAGTDGVIDLNQSLITPAPPSAFRGIAGPSLFQTALALGEPVGREVDGSRKPIDQLSYKPADGWGSIDPWDFDALESTYTDAATGETLYHSDLAKSSVWRDYRISGQATGGFSPQALIGSPVAPASIKDLGPFLGTLLSRDLATGERLPAYARGTYADERLGYDNSKPNARFPGSITIDNEYRIVSFDTPLFKYDANGRPAPADVVLIAAYQCSKDGVPTRMEFLRPNPIGGVTAGEAIDVRDEISREVIEAKAASNGVASDSAAKVAQQLNYYLDALAAKYVDVPAVNKRFGGLRTFRCDGQLRSITWSFSNREPPTTLVSWNCERSTAIVPYENRKIARLERSVKYHQRQLEAKNRIAASRASAKETS